MRQSLLAPLLIAIHCVSGLTAPAGPRAKPKAPPPGIALPITDCPTLAPLPDGAAAVAGVANDGDPKLTATRQRIVLGRSDGKQFAELTEVSPPGLVYFPTVAARNSDIWLAWSQFEDGDWRIVARRQSQGALSPMERISGDLRACLWPSIAISPGGQAWCAWSARGRQDFDVFVSRWDGRQWSQPEAITGPGFHEMRPAVVVDSQGTVTVAWDYYADERLYRIDMRRRGESGWGPVIRMMQHHSSPSLTAGADGSVWVTANDGQTVVWRNGQRYWVSGKPVKLWPQDKGGLPITRVSVDPQGRLWLFGFRGGRKSPARLRYAAFTSAGVEAKGEARGASVLYQAPLVTANTVFLVYGTSRKRLMTIATDAATGQAPALQAVGALAAPKPVQRADVAGLRRTVELGGRTYTAYFAELHTHLTESVTDAHIRDRVDGYYLDARYDKRLDAAGLSDHDHAIMTQSKYVVQQAITQALSPPGEFVGLSGYEWSGSGPIRKRYGDRTVVFRPGYFIPPRITDPASNTPRKLHAELRKLGAIDWPHHVGAPWAVMDWTTFENDVEPVVEITSAHGVFETYDPQDAVPVNLLHGREPQRSLEDRKVDKTSIQYGLSQGNRFGLVGSSDSHSGITGYKSGMLGLYATELTADAVFDAWKQRRTFAVRGGDRLTLALSCGDAILGQSATVNGAPRLVVNVSGTRPLSRIDVVRDNAFVHAKSVSGESSAFAYEDTGAEVGKHVYYIRVWQTDNGYAWSTPIWVTVQ